MLTEIASWIDAHMMSLLLTGLTLQFFCWWAMSKRRLPLSAVIIPSNLSLLLVIAVDAAPMLLPQGGDALSALLTVAMLWLLWKENKIFYRQWRQKKRVQQLMAVATPTIRLLSRLFSDGKLESLDSESPNERLKALAAALRAMLSVTRIFDKGGVWRLVSCNVPGQRVETLRLQIAQKALGEQPAEEQVPVKTYQIQLVYRANGSVKDVRLQGGSLSHAHLKLVAAEDSSEPAYWALRS